MSQTAITLAFEEYLAEQQLGGQPVVLDEIVLAHIPGLDLSQPIDRAAGLPDASRIVHRQKVDQRGKINANGVAYSIVMDTNQGDFTFNTMYLIHKASGLVAMVVHKAEEDKLKNLLNRPGNSLVKSMLMEYQGAAEATLTHVDAGTWQIDFTARLMGLDKDIQQQAQDHYGDAAFIADGFAVRPGTGVNEFLVTPGLGYIAGLRTELPSVQSVTVAQRPAVLYADVYHAGNLLSDWHTLVTIRASTTPLNDYVDEAGYPHYVTPLASLSANGAVTDLRGRGGLWWHEHRPDAHTKDQVGLSKLENWSWSHSYTDATGGAQRYASGKAVADSHNKLNSTKLNAASYTAADVLKKLLTVDGAGSGIDGDLLDGYHGAYYLDWRNFTHTPDFVLQKDVLDSYAQSYTLRSAADVGYTSSSTSGRFAHLRGGTGSAGLTFTQALAEAASLGVRLPTVDELEDGIAEGTGAGFNSTQCWTCTAVPGKPGYVYTVRGDGAAGTRVATQTNSVATADCRYVANVNVPKIWHAANDGAGSGMDADTVDGVQAEQLLRSDIITNWHTGQAGFRFATALNIAYLQSLNSAGNDVAEMVLSGYYGRPAPKIRLISSVLQHNTETIWTAGNDGPGSGMDADTVDGLHAHELLRQASGYGVDLRLGKYFYFRDFDENNADRGLRGYVRDGILHLGLTPGDTSAAAGIRLNGSIVWHSGNDGHGSSLDADTVDGRHADWLRNWGNLIGRPATALRWPKWSEVTEKPDLGSQLIAEVRSGTTEAYSGNGMWSPKESQHLKHDFQPEGGATYQITAKVSMGYATSTEGGLRDIDFYTWLEVNGAEKDMTAEDLLSSQGEGRTFNLTYTGPITAGPDGVARIRIGFKCGGGDNPGSYTELKLWGLNITNPHVWDTFSARNNAATKSVLTIVKL